MTDAEQLAAILALPLTTAREQELEDLTERWHAGEFGDKQLHEVFGMTWEEYGEWLQPKTSTTEEK